MSGARAAQSRAATNPWLIARPGGGRLLHGGARLHHRQRRAALHRGRHGGERGRGILGGHDVSGRQRHHRHRHRLSCQSPRPQEFLPHLPGAVHDQLADVRAGVEPSVDAAVPHPAGSRGRRHGAGRAVHPGRRLPAGEARPGLRPVRRRGGGGAGGRADARRLACGQCCLDLVLPDQRAGRRVHDGGDRDGPARGPRPPRRSRQRGRARFDLVGFALVATFLGALELVLDRGLEDDWFGSSFIVKVVGRLRARLCADDPVGDAATATRRSMSGCWPRGSSARASW